VASVLLIRTYGKELSVKLVISGSSKTLLKTTLSLA
jgi:hypothetical protein